MYVGVGTRAVGGGVWVGSVSKFPKSGTKILSYNFYRVCISVHSILDRKEGRGREKWRGKGDGEGKGRWWPSIPATTVLIEVVGDVRGRQLPHLTIMRERGRFGAVEAPIPATIAQVKSSATPDVVNHFD
ncbi:hypothetical protein CRG98_047172 [Punica granatum]|uniref:Uncharacterized protein n=1 Tax=Punica granatum TaxID=22663 RepID=A0A2I0HL73_PUNGR|nr:hypothetical protein CRG98_047172 [Punica granatum]